MCLERAPEHLEQVATVRARWEAGHVPPVQLDQADQRDRIGVGDVRDAMPAAELRKQDPFVVGGSVTGPGVREQLRLRWMSVIRYPRLRLCGSVHTGHGSSAGHSRGPPTELTDASGRPGRGCSRVVTPWNAPRFGKRSSTCTGRGGVVLVMAETLSHHVGPAHECPCCPNS